MDFWLNVLILSLVAAGCFYVGYRVGFVSGELSECDCGCWFEKNADDAEDGE